MEKKRLDPRVKFQHADFTRKLHAARNYKRTSRPRPDSRLQAGLEKVGMASLLAQLFFAAAIIIAAYLLYVPNPLFVRAVRVEGLNSEYRPMAEKAVKDYQSRQPWYVPQNNILFVNADKLARAIAEGVPSISKIESSNKLFRSKSVVVSVVQKYERYIAVRPDGELILHNDGTIKGQLPGKIPELPLTSGALVTVKINDTASVKDGEPYFSREFVELLEQAADLFPAQTGQNLAYFEVKLPDKTLGSNEKFAESWKQSGIVEVVNKKPGSGKSNPPQLRIILEPGLDIPSAAERLKLLLDQTAADRYRSLYYVDLRLANRAYLCLVNAPCAAANP